MNNGYDRKKDKAEEPPFGDVTDVIVGVVEGAVEVLGAIAGGVLGGLGELGE